MSTSRKAVWSWNGDAASRRSDEVAVEEPLEIRVDTRPVSVTMRTPGHDDELAAGFLFTEGLIRRRAEIQQIKPYSRNPNRNVVDVFLAPGVKIDLGQLARRVFASSSCGICGKASIEYVNRQFKPLRSRFTIDAGTLQQLPERMRGHQQTFDRTGGLHAAAVFDGAGNLVVVREDIGRHNAVDKVIGFALLKDLLPLDRHILVVSGRASFEIMQKSLAARLPVVCAVSAPSSLAVEFARASGQVLVGFLREKRMNVYAGRRRIRPIG